MIFLHFRGRYPLFYLMALFLSVRVIGDLSNIVLSKRLRHSGETIFNIDVLFMVGDANGNFAIQFFGFTRIRLIFNNLL